MDDDVEDVAIDASDIDGNSMVVGEASGVEEGSTGVEDGAIEIEDTRDASDDDSTIVEVSIGVDETSLETKNEV